MLPQQAVVISKAVDALDNTQHRDAAEAHLIKEAAHFDAHKLAELGRRILETVDPEKADEHEAKLLEKQEAKAAKKTQFRLYDDGEGLSHGRFTMPTAQAAMLRKALQALAAPKHVRATEGAGSYDYEKPTPEKLGKAFCEYVERYPADKLPSMGGINATIIVTVDVDVLQGAHQAAHLDTGHAISPGQLRRWACEAKILPAVMDGQSHVLDLGRSKRFHTAAQRTGAVDRAADLPAPHLRHPRRVLPHPPQPPLVPRRGHQHPGRLAVVPLPPPPSPRHRPELPAPHLAGAVRDSSRARSGTRRACKCDRASSARRARELCARRREEKSASPRG